jgi:hypothetical protein
MSKLINTQPAAREQHVARDSVMLSAEAFEKGKSPLISLWRSRDRNPEAILKIYEMLTYYAFMRATCPIQSFV